MTACDGASVAFFELFSRAHQNLKYIIYFIIMVLCMICTGNPQMICDDPTQKILDYNVLIYCDMSKTALCLPPRPLGR